MLLQEDFRNMTVRELETLALELQQIQLYKSSKIAELLNELYYVISDESLNIVVKNKTENNQIIFEK